MKLSEIQELIRFVAKSGVTEIELELKDFKINIKTPARKRRGGLVHPSEVIMDDLENDVQVTTQPAVMPVAVQAMPTPAPPAAPATPAADNNAKEDESKYITVKSPMIGTFYRSPSPDKPPFCNVGDDIKIGDIICIVEAMKLFNEIEAEVAGKIVKILADDATPVEYDQPIFLVEPH